VVEHKEIDDKVNKNKEIYDKINENKEIDDFTFTSHPRCAESLNVVNA